MNQNEVEALVEKFKLEVFDKIPCGKADMAWHDMGLAWALGREIHPFNARLVAFNIALTSEDWEK